MVSVKTMKLEDIRKHNKERRETAIRDVRKVYPDFKPGDRAFDRPRKNKDKQKFLNEMRVRENEIRYK